MYHKCHPVEVGVFLHAVETMSVHGTACMMTSCHGNAFSALLALCRGGWVFWGCVCVCVCGKGGGHAVGYQRIPSQRANAELWCFLCWTPEHDFEQSVELPVIRNAKPMMWHHAKQTVFVHGKAGLSHHVVTWSRQSWEMAQYLRRLFEFVVWFHQKWYVQCDNLQ